MQKFNVFFLKKPYGIPENDSLIKKQWKNTLGSERILNISTPGACVDIILGAIALTTGARTLSGYIEDMKGRGQTRDRIEEVIEALLNYSTKITNGKVKIIKNTANIANNKRKNIRNKKLHLGVFQSDLEEINILCDAFFGLELDDKMIKYREELRNLQDKLGENVPQEFICPLTNKIISIPVLIRDGYTYESKAIKCWFEKYDYSPITAEKLNSEELFPNYALKQLIQSFLDANIK